jgi:hypothetical protein
MKIWHERTKRQGGPGPCDRIGDFCREYPSNSPPSVVRGSAVKTEILYNYYYDDPNRGFIVYTWNGEEEEVWDQPRFMQLNRVSVYPQRSKGADQQSSECEDHFVVKLSNTKLVDPTHWQFTYDRVLVT